MAVLLFLQVCHFGLGTIAWRLARSRGRRAPLWFCLGVLSGVFALIALAVKGQSRSFIAMAAPRALGGARGMYALVTTPRRGGSGV